VREGAYVDFHVGLEIAALGEGAVAAGMGALVRSFPGVASVVDLEGAGSHERSPAQGTLEGPAFVTDISLPLVVMSANVVFQVALRRELLRAVLARAFVGLLAGVDPLVGLEVAFFGEGLGAAFVGTLEGPFPGLGR
jgi:hypothetical protein